MRVGFIGLGRMGSAMAEKLLQAGHEVLAYDPSEEARAGLSEKAQVAEQPGEVAQGLSPPRVVWLMVPEGVVQDVLQAVVPALQGGDVLVDGGNSHYRRSMDRAKELAGRGIGFLDVGTSGGLWGRKEGYCLMVGGQPGAFGLVEPLLKALAEPRGAYALLGPSGAGHYAKMVHNAIEYGMMQALGEGFELLRAPKELDFSLAQVARLWGQGSVVRSWLLELLQEAFRDSPELQDIAPYVEDTGEGRWAVMEAVERSVPLASIALALQARFRSRQEESFSAKVVAALRKQFGGHKTRRK